MSLDAPVFIGQRDPRWVSFNNGPGRWDRAAESPGFMTTANGGYLPPPPRNPRLAALLAASNAFGMTSDELIGDRITGHREIHHFKCWRLRWCAFCLVVANAMQASVVGVQLQNYFSVAPGAARAPSAGANLVGSTLLLATLLIALWSLLSQLLLWSDAAVMKVPEGVHVRDTRSRMRLDSPARDDDDDIV